MPEWAQKGAEGSRKAELAAVIAVFLLAVGKLAVSLLLMARYGAVVFGGEGVIRSLIAWWWGQGLTQGIPGALLPMQTYLVGFLSLFTSSPYAASVGLNLFCSVLSVPALYAAARFFSVKRLPALAGTLLAAAIPWHTFLGISQRSFSLELFLMLLSVLMVGAWERWEKPHPDLKTFGQFIIGYYEPRDLLVIVSGLFSMVAVLAGLNAWAVLIVTTGFFIVRMVQWRMNPPTFLIWFLFAWVAPVSWCLRSYWYYQDYFSVFKAAAGGKPQTPISAAVSALTALPAFFAVAPFVVIFIALGWLRYRAIGRSALWAWFMLALLFSTAGFTALGVFQQKDLPWTITMAAFVSSIPAGEALVRIGRRKSRILAAGLLLAAILQCAATTLRLPYVTGAAKFDSGLKLARLMGESWREDLFLRNTCLVLERVEDPNAGFDGPITGLISGKPLKVYYDDIAVQFGVEGSVFLKPYSESVRVPNVWALNIPRRQVTMFSRSLTAAAFYLKRMNAGVVALATPELQKNLPSNYLDAGRLGRYRIFVNSHADVASFRKRLERIGADFRLYEPPVTGKAFVRLAKEFLNTQAILEIETEPLDGLKVRYVDSAGDAFLADVPQFSLSEAAGEKKSDEKSIFLSLGEPAGGAPGLFDVAVCTASGGQYCGIGKFFLADSRLDLLATPNRDKLSAQELLRVLVSLWW